MNDNLSNALLNNEEFKDKIAKAQSREECMELLKEYGIQLTDTNVAESDNGVLSDDILANVSGGFDIDDVIYTSMRCDNAECGYATRKKGYWVGVIEKCPKCGQESLHGKQLIIPG